MFNYKLLNGSGTPKWGVVFNAIFIYILEMVQERASLIRNHIVMAPVDNSDQNVLTRSNVQLKITVGNYTLSFVCIL